MGKLEGAEITIGVRGEILTVLQKEKDGGPGSYVSLESDQLDELITLLVVHRTNYFQGRNSSKPDRRQGTRRQGDKTEIKLKAMYPKADYSVCSCGKSGCYYCTED